MPTNNMIKSKWPKCLWFSICNIDTPTHSSNLQLLEVNFSIWTKRIVQQNEKSNIILRRRTTTYLDDEQYNANDKTITKENN
jgi:hypothetical protein